jgi:hypothetical protein
MNPRDYTASMSKIKCYDNFKNKMEKLLDNKEVTKIEVTKAIGKECADYVSGVEKAPNSRIKLRITAAACAAVALIGGNAVLLGKNTSFFQKGPESQLAGVADTTEDETNIKEEETNIQVNVSDDSMITIMPDENDPSVENIIINVFDDHPVIQQINEHLKKLDKKAYVFPIGVEYTYYKGMGDFTYPTENSAGGFEEDAEYDKYTGIVTHQYFDDVKQVEEVMADEGREYAYITITRNPKRSDEDDTFVMGIGINDEIPQDGEILPEHQFIIDNNFPACNFYIEKMVNVCKEVDSYLKYNEEKNVLEYYHKDLDIKYLDVYYDGNELIINQYANIYADKYSVYETPLETKVKFNSEGDIVYYSNVSPMHEMQLGGDAVIMEVDYVNYDRELYENAFSDKAVVFGGGENDDVTIFGNGDSEITD